MEPSVQGTTLSPADVERILLLKRTRAPCWLLYSSNLEHACLDAIGHGPMLATLSSLPFTSVVPAGLARRGDAVGAFASFTNTVQLYAGTAQLFGF